MCAATRRLRSDFVDDAVTELSAVKRGTIERAVNADDDTLSRIGSVTKTFTGTAMMRLAEKGKVRLDATVRASLQHDLNQYLSARSKIEHISAISLSISLHGQTENINLAAGQTRYGGGTPVTPDQLWQIGSNTKAFTAATIPQLEAEGKLAR